MHADLLLFLLVMVLGCAAFVFGILYLLCRVIGIVGRSLFGAVRPRPADRSRADQVRGANAMVCPRADCRNVEYRDARFCSHCGTRFDP